MHSKLVKMAPTFDASLIHGTRVEFKKYTKKGKLIVEGTGEVSRMDGATSLWIRNDAHRDAEFWHPHESVYVTAADVMYGRVSLRVIDIPK